jgi:hypothetical protein
MSLAVLTMICGVISLGILAVMAGAFWASPDRGLALTTHRVELLPRVMAGRYTAFALLAVFALVQGDPALYAAFFAVCAFMGFADGLIYARAGLPHSKHTLSGVLSVVAFGVALANLLVEKGF